MPLLENQVLTLSFDVKGAELKSVFDKRIQKNIVYDGFSPFWNRSAPVLFPFVGRLKNNSFSFNGKSYSMTQHGFARDAEFRISERTATQISFQLKASEQSKRDYPFDFILNISYELIACKVVVRYEVINPSGEELLFSIGAHPGFVCPLHEDEKFEDYFLEFSGTKNNELERFLLDPGSGLLNGESEKMRLEHQQLPLTYSYFSKDAVILSNLDTTKIYLKSKKSSYHLCFSFSDCPYFGIWTKAGAPFICLEPWYGISDSETSTGKLNEKEGIISLAPSESFKQSYSFEIFI